MRGGASDAVIGEPVCRHHFGIIQVAAVDHDGIFEFLVKAGEIDTSRAREVLIEMIASGQSAAEVMKAQGIVKVDESALYAIGQELIEANPKIVADIKSGKLQAASNLIGQAKKRKPNVNPGRFREIVIELVCKM